MNSVTEARTSSCGIFQELRIHSISGYLDIANHRATDKAVLHRNLRVGEQSRTRTTVDEFSYHVGMPGLIRHLNIIEPDVQKPALNRTCG